MTFISMVLTANAQVNAAGKPEQSQACLSSAECKQYRPKGNAADSVMQHVKGNRFSVGGYGEVAYSRNFYSDHVSRYSQPEKHKNDPTHGRLDIPHVVIYLGYDFGKGWSVRTWWCWSCV